MEQSKKPPRSYKDLKQKQKTKISDYMYLETQDFFQTNGRMPDTDEDCKAVAQKVFNHLSGLRVPTEEIHAVYLRKRPHIIERLTIFGMPGISVPMQKSRNCSASERKEKPIPSAERNVPKMSRSFRPWSRTTPFSSSRVTPPVARHMVLPGRKWNWSRGKI